MDQHSEPQPKLRSDLIDEVCGRFQAAWCQSQQPRIEDFLPAELLDANPENLRKLLVALVAVDLEWRWQPAGDEPAVNTTPQAAPAVPETTGLPPQPRLADYVTQYPALGPLEELPIDLILNEYYARQRYGDQPTHQEYLAAFGQHHPSLGDLLSQVDREQSSVGTGKQTGAEIGTSPHRRRSALHIRCPHCHNPIEIIHDHRRPGAGYARLYVTRAGQGRKPHRRPP